MPPPPRLRLLDEELHLDPEIARYAQQLEAELAAQRDIRLWLQPDWRRLLPLYSELFVLPARRTITWEPPARQEPRVFVPDPRFATPRPGEVTDILRALYSYPVVQRLVLQAREEGQNRLRLLWNEVQHGTPAARGAIVLTGLATGTAIGILMANNRTRHVAFGLIRGHDIPVPGVDGLSFQILDRGGAVTTPLGLPGLSATGRLQFPASLRHPDYEFMITFDVEEYLRSRRR